MEKTVLKLQEFYALETELLGLKNNQTDEVISKGLLGEKIKLTTKYWLNDLVKKISSEKEELDKLRTELVTKYGTSDDNGNLVIPFYINEVIDEETKEVVSREVNPNFQLFQKEFGDLLNEEREIEHYTFKLEDFDNVESEGVYSTFFKLIKVSEENA